VHSSAISVLPIFGGRTNIIPPVCDSDHNWSQHDRYNTTSGKSPTGGVCSRPPSSSPELEVGRSVLLLFGACFLGLGLGRWGCGMGMMKVGWEMDRRWIEG